MRDDRGGRVAVVSLDHQFHIVGSKHLDRRVQRRFGQRVRIHAQKERAIDPLCTAIVADRLRDGQNVPLVKGATHR